jgi:hypothetical protein
LHELEALRAARWGQPTQLVRVDLQGPAEVLAATKAAIA